MKSHWRDPGFVYHPAAEHVSQPHKFRNRMKARLRNAQPSEKGTGSVIILPDRKNAHR